MSLREQLARLAARPSNWLAGRPPLRWEVPGRLTIRATLLAGFGLIFILWLASGYTIARRLAELEFRAAAIRSSVAQSEGSLFTVRTQVLLGAVYLRDALLDPTPEALNHYRDQLVETRKKIEQALEDYTPVIDSPAEREDWDKLRDEMDDYWDIVMPVLAWEPDRRAAEARTYLRERVLPKREIVIRISERIQALNREAFDERQDEIARMHRSMRQRLRWTSSLAGLLGLVIALVVVRYAGRLEDRIHSQHLRALENQRDLRRLSARLVHAQEEERRSISRELHDEIGQALTAIKMELALAARRPESRQAIEEARAIADRTLQAVRDLSHLLHPSMLDDLGLPSTLEWYLKSFSRRTGIRAELFQDRMESRLALELELSAYRIIQEALTNAARHSGASLCRVYVQRLAHTLLITVEDDGKGFDPRSAETLERRGLGLVGIRERVSDLGGILRLESNPGRGTRLSAELPAVPAGPEEPQPAPEPQPAERSPQGGPRDG